MKAITTIGILGAGQAGRALARALANVGYDIRIANSGEPKPLGELADLDHPRIVPVWAADAAAQADVAILAFPYAPGHALPTAELADKIVLDNNNYMPWRDGNLLEVDAGTATVHELRQAQIPAAKLAKAFSHIQFHGLPQVRHPGDELPALVRLARPAGSLDRVALAVASDYQDAIDAAAVLYDDVGFDAVAAGPLSESWRNAPGTPAWQASFAGQSRAELERNLRAARRPGR